MSVWLRSLLVTSWACLVLVSIIRLNGVYTFTNNWAKLGMSKFARLAEQRTCDYHLGPQWYAFASMYVWNESFRFYVDWRKPSEEPFEFRMSPNREPQKKLEYPIYYVNIDRYYDKYRYFKMESDEIQKQHNRFITRFFYPLDDIKILFIFEYDNEVDTYLVHYINGIKQNLSESHHQPSGFIPLVHMAKETSFVPKSMISFINNRDYSYRSGHLQIDPIELKFDHTYYYGFDTGLNTIYFGEKMSYLEKNVENYLAASAVLDGSSWHPFLCHNYVYIVTEVWVLVFPHLQLHIHLKQLNNSAILKAEMVLYHINTLFRCVNEMSKTVPLPRYPKQEIKIHLHRDNVEESKSLSSKTVPIIITVMLVVVALLVVFIFIRRKNNKKSLRRSSIWRKSNNKNKSKSSLSTMSTISQRLRKKNSLLLPSTCELKSLKSTSSLLRHNKITSGSSKKSSSLAHSISKNSKLRHHRSKKKSSSRNGSRKSKIK